MAFPPEPVKILDKKNDLMTKRGEYDQLPTFSNSHYKKLYNQTPIPDQNKIILESADSLIEAYQKEYAHAISLEDCILFRESLHRSLELTLSQSQDPLDVPTLSIKLWTSNINLKGKEFCGILNHAIRSDKPELLKHAVIISRGINVQCVIRKKIAPAWPDDNITYRGGGLPQQYRSFYEPKKTYRAPMFIATSTKKHVALNMFCSRVTAPCEPVLWKFHFHPDCKCVHVNYLDKSLIEGEEEFLFSAYSVFTVMQVDWKESPTWINAHVIDLAVSPDNLLEKEDLPLAPWC